MLCLNVVKMDAYNCIVKTRILCFTTLLSSVGLFLWIFSLSTSYWYYVSSNTPIYINLTKKWFIGSHSGIWEYCRITFRNESENEITEEVCRYHKWYSSSTQHPPIDSTILAYRRTNAAFSIITFFLMFLAICFSLYSLKNPFYMYKRVAAGIYILSAAGVAVIIEIFITSIHHELKYFQFVHPSGSFWNYAYSFYLACCTVAICTITGIIFLTFSKKRKKNFSAYNETFVHNQSAIIGR